MSGSLCGAVPGPLRDGSLSENKSRTTNHDRTGSQMEGRDPEGAHRIYNFAHNKSNSSVIVGKSNWSRLA